MEKHILKLLGLRKFGFVDRQQLNYAGRGKGKENRKKTLCGDGTCCKGQTMASGVNKGTKLTCDEYPFASTTQSSNESWVGCILDFQNTAGGFFYLNNFLRSELKYTKNCPYIMQIDPSYDCTKVQASSIPGCNPKKTRRAELETAATNGVFYDAYNSAPGTLIIPLGDLPAGSYSVDVTFPTGAVVSRVLIGDVDGEEYNVQDSPSSGSTYTFTAVIDDVAYSAALIAETTSNDLSVVSWSVESTGDTPPFSSGGSTLPSSTSSAPSSASQTSLKTTSESQGPSGSSTVTIVTVISGVTTTITTCPVTKTKTNPPPPTPTTTTTTSFTVSTITTCISGVTITTTTTCPVVTASESTLPSLPPHHSYSHPPPPPPPPPPGGNPSSVKSLSPPPGGESNTGPPPVQSTTPTTESTHAAPTTPTTATTPFASVVVTATAAKANILAANVVWVVLGASLLIWNL